MIRVAILGAGKIAQGYDDVESDTILTHTKAYQRNPNFEIVAFCDADFNQAKEAAEKWSVPNAVANFEDLKGLNPSVLSICTPDETHPKMLASCLDLQAELVFCEKPLGLERGEAREIVDRYSEANVGLMVNYSRRWSDSVEECRELIAKEEFGEICSIRSRYYGGWFHNGSHLVDLISLFFEPKLQGGNLLRKKEFSSSDFRLTGSVLLEQKGRSFPFYFECLDDDHVSHFELELLFEKGAFWMGERDGSVWKKSPICENALYPGYYELNEGELRMADPSKTMVRAVENIERFVSKRAPLLSNGVTSLRTLELCEEICGISKIEN